MLHIIISVKDFKAIVQHAGSLDTEVSAAYSYPSKPMQLKYGDESVTSEFILMTIGDYKATSAVPLPNTIMRNSTSAASRQQTEDPSVANVVQQPAASMQPPPRSGGTPASLLGHRARSLRHSPPLPQPSINSDSLFLPDDEEDRRWNPSGYGGEEVELLGWDAGTDTVRINTSKLSIWRPRANMKHRMDNSRHLLVAPKRVTLRFTVYMGQWLGNEARVLRMLHLHSEYPRSENPP